MFAQALKDEVAAVLERAVVTDLRDPEQFRRYLQVCYHVIRASEPLLKTAANIADGPLLAYYRSHLEEERQHAEWCYRDLALFQKSEAGIFPCPAVASQFAGSQYYHLLHTSVTSLLAYMLVLEGFPMAMSTVEELEMLYGTQVVTTIRHHAEHDPSHQVELMAMIDAMADRYHAHIRQVALETAELSLQIFEYVRG